MMTPVPGREPDVPVDGVGAEKREVHPGGPGRQQCRPHGARVILVMAKRDHRPRPAEQARILVEIDIGLIGERDAGPFRQREVAWSKGDETHRAVAVVGAVERHRGAAVGRTRRALVQAVAAPHVVGLPRGDIIEHDDRTGGARRPDRHGHEPLRTAGATRRSRYDPAGHFEVLIVSDGRHGTVTMFDPAKFHRRLPLSRGPEPTPTPAAPAPRSTSRTGTPPPATTSRWWTRTTGTSARKGRSPGR